MTERILRVGILGLASIARRKVIPALLKLPNKYQLVLVGSLSNKNSCFIDGVEVNVVKGYDEVLADKSITLIYISLPNSLHFIWAKKALENRKHVLCEKSLTPSFSATHELVKLARKNKLMLKENFQFIYHKQSKKILKILEDKVLGEIKLIRCDFAVPPFKEKNNIRYKKQLGGGALLDVGCYPLKFLNYFFPSKWVFNHAELFYRKSFDCDLSGTASLYNSNNICAQIYFSFENTYTCCFEIIGSEGKLSGSRIFTATSDTDIVFNHKKNDLSKKISVGRCDQFVNQFEAVYREIVEGEFSNEYNDSLKQGELLDSFFRQAKSTVL